VEQGAVPAGGFANCSRAAPGIKHAGTTTGVGGAVPGLGQVKAGNARQFDELACDYLETGFPDHTFRRVPGSVAWS